MTGPWWFTSTPRWSRSARGGEEAADRIASVTLAATTPRPEASARRDQPMPWALLAAGALAMFAAASSGTTRAPFLLDMARDLSTSMPLVADLVAATSISWAVAGMVAGAGS